MNQEQDTEKLKELVGNKLYKGTLSSYAVESIKLGRSNYPVSNLLAYCNDFDLKVVMMDLTTEDCFYPKTVFDVHKILELLMDRYNIDTKAVYRKTSIHYTLPKSNQAENTKGAAPLSIKTLLAVCQVIHCDLLFGHN